MRRYMLREATYGILLGPEGQEMAEGWLEAGQLVWVPVSTRVTEGNSSPLDGRYLGNRPSGRLMYDSAGVAWVLPEDAHLEETK